MNCIKNQQGYALLVVLLIITVIGISAPILVNNVLSSSNQFSMVEEQMQHEKLSNMAYIYIDRTFEEIAKEYVSYLSSLDENEEPESPKSFFTSRVEEEYSNQYDKQAYKINLDNALNTQFTFNIVTLVNSEEAPIVSYTININDYFN
ncbi:type II secretion system protein [Alkalihalophilus marmarensis]|uniref:type II secretion system protein n=1 Tax=Alkalihalophilus marmarensis TaxID=521377 RepID=UPI002DBC76B9|nr:type II secretion system protein [Alkalihalophilus marmarensis]MEC2072275.1 type II secretion system protein [Alkalihalophilus marmarensis]